MEFIYLLIGAVIGGVIAWIISSGRIKSAYISKAEFDNISKLNIESNIELTVQKEKVSMLNSRNSELSEELKKKSEDYNSVSSQYASKNTECNNYKMQLEDIQFRSSEIEKVVDAKEKELNNMRQDLMRSNTELESLSKTSITQESEIAALKKDLNDKTTEYNELNKKFATIKANYDALNEKLETQKTEIEELRRKFNTEFENIAAKILDDKSQKFTKMNQENLAGLLNPLGEKIKDFKDKVESAYIKESMERHSLKDKVAELIDLNQKLSEEANNLTNALKGSSKTQGDWGQMILENILEKSGLAKDREYFVQSYLKDDDGNYLTNEDGTKMQPDIIVEYPDNKKIIIDSKVSLSAYTRYCNCDNKEEQKKAIDEHLKSIKNHVVGLSGKNYQEYAPTLDFVMMFIPNEPAYLLALQNDPELWSYAYSKKIVLISPTNLIAALKLIVDLWKRENQNKNAMEIAERGSLLYDKFVGFIDSMKDIGFNLDKAKKSYDDAYKQLKDGSGNLIGQAQKLKELGVKSKKNLPSNIANEALNFSDAIIPKQIEN